MSTQAKYRVVYRFPCCAQSHIFCQVVVTCRCDLAKVTYTFPVCNGSMTCMVTAAYASATDTVVGMLSGRPRCFTVRYPPGTIVSTMHSASAIVNSFFFIVNRTSLYSSVCLCLFCPKTNTNASTLQYLRNERAYSVLKNRFLANMVDILSYIIQYTSMFKSSVFCILQR